MTSLQILTFWHARGAGGAEPVRTASAASVAGPAPSPTPLASMAAAGAWLLADGTLSLVPVAGASAVVHGIRRGTAVGVLVVAAGGQVARNGVACSPGLHALAHADALTTAGGPIWVSADVEAMPVPYDPSVHGDDQFCARTKARLAPGEPIIVCPGTAQQVCGNRFKQSAWALGLPCHVCAHDPARPRWQPPALADVTRLQTLLAVVTGQRPREGGSHAR